VTSILYYRNFFLHAEKVAIRGKREIDEDSEICFVEKGRRKSGIVGFTDAAKRRGGKKMPKASTKILGGEKRRN
jgi:hypothetical protein